MNNKIVLGLLVGTALGVLDGLSAWFQPEARPMIAVIVIGSTIKGLLTGAVIGYVARKMPSAAAVLGIGLAVGLLLSYLAALQPDASGQHHFVEIMVPGAVLALIVGFVVLRYPRSS
jgi:hypothetical protein